MKALHGSVLCKELPGADIVPESGTKRIRSEQLRTKLRPGSVVDASAILSELLET
jgi:hypothetical protein